MSHTYHQLLYHLVWSTKNRQPFITKDIQNTMYEYIVGTFRLSKCNCILIGGMPDHVHICAAVPPSISISEIIRTVKVSSSKWCQKNHTQVQNFEWQEGYGAFSVSPSNKDAVLQYIRNQEEHHKKYNFREEFLLLLRKHHVQFDENYVWK